MTPIPFITKQKWWSFILDDEIGYISKEASIQLLYIHYPEKIIFEKMPSMINGWELLFFIGIFLSALALRIIFKVQ